MSELFPKVVWDDFADFWTTVPRKEGKLQAQKAYRMARKFHTAMELKESMILYANKVKDREMKHRLMPATWLNNERWNDEEPILSSDKPKADRVWSDKVWLAKLGPTISRHAPTVEDLKLMLEHHEITQEQADKWPLMRN